MKPARKPPREVSPPPSVLAIDAELELVEEEPRSSTSPATSSSSSSSEPTPADTLRAELAILPREARATVVSAASVAVLAKLEERSREHEAARSADETRRKYAHAWRTFTEWCGAHGLEALPAHPDVVRLWLVALELEGKSLSTISVFSAAINKAHTLADLPVPRSDRLRAMFAGLRRELGPKRQQAQAISLPEVRAIVATCDTRTINGLRDRALLLCLFFLACRRSELCRLELADLTREAEGFVVRVRKSKRDQTGKGKTRGLPINEPPEVCPVRALEAWLAARAKIPGRDASAGPVFPSLRLLRTPGPWAYLDGRDIARRVQAHAEAAGFDPVRFRPHGFRAGFATATSRKRANVRDIQEHLGHSTLASTMVYVRAGDALGDENPARVLTRRGGAE